MGVSTVIRWLMEGDQPAVQYCALTELLERPHNDPEVREARAMISERGWASDVLKEQMPGGYWNNREHLHRPKYIATLWRLLVLADLGLTAEYSQIREACERFLQNYVRDDGGFGRAQSHFCITGNLARTLIHCGYGSDQRVRKALDWLVGVQKDDGGWHCFPSSRGLWTAGRP